MNGANSDAVFRAAEAVGDAWSWLVLREAILHGATRFAEFQQRLGIARSTLSARLSQLVDGGLLERVQGATRADHYGLTAAGADFFGCLMAAMRWGDRWCCDGSPPLVVTHRACGQDARPEFRCRACTLVVQARDVDAAHPRAELSRIPGSNHRAPDHALLLRGGPCSIAGTQTVIGDWWSIMVVREAFYGAHRFDDFRSNLGVATNILTSRLNRLVDHGVLERVPYQSNPVRHEYRLTDKGLDIYPVPLSMIAWAERWKSPDGPTADLTHKPCGQRLEPVLSCGSCGVPVSRSDVDLQSTVPNAVEV